MLTCFLSRLTTNDANRDLGVEAQVFIIGETDENHVHMDMSLQDGAVAISFVLTTDEARRLARALLAASELAAFAAE